MLAVFAAAVAALAVVLGAVVAWRRRGVRFEPARRMVRLHLAANEPSIEGVLLGRWGGDYHLLRAVVIAGPGHSIPLEGGGSARVPTGQVVFVQDIAS